MTGMTSTLVLSQSPFHYSSEMVTVNTSDPLNYLVIRRAKGLSECISDLYCAHRLDIIKTLKNMHM